MQSSICLEDVDEGGPASTERDGQPPASEPPPVTANFEPPPAPPKSGPLIPKTTVDDVACRRRDRPEDAPAVPEAVVRRVRPKHEEQRQCPADQGVHARAERLGDGPKDPVPGRY